MKKLHLCLLITTGGLYYSASAQSVNHDLVLLEQKNISYKKITSTKNKTHNPLTKGYMLAIKLYQLAISEQLATNCAFDLTCSRFSKAMVTEYGLVKGYFLTFDRISRCNVISPLETFPIRLTEQGKIIERPENFRFH